MKLKKDLKFWIFHNIKAFFKTDPYFKFLSANVYLAEFKGILAKSHTLSDLKKNLSDCKVNFKFEFLRKVEGGKSYYFRYPSLYFQIESMIKTWGEIKEVEKKLREELNLQQLAMPKFSVFEDQENSFDENLDNDFLYGLRPNLCCYHLIEQEKDLTLYSYEMSKVSTIRPDFKREYSSFKQNIRATTRGIAENDGVGLFFQTDIKKFYHSITPEIAANFLTANYSGLETLVSYTKKLGAIGYDELPIGWILSGTVAYFILVKFHRELQAYLDENLQVMRKKKNIIESVKVVSYVDDFIFLIKTSKPLSDAEKEYVEKNILDVSEGIFEDLISEKRILFHRETQGGKNKIFDITPSFAGVVDSNFFNLITESSVVEVDGLDIFEELMLPGDNNLILNERVQFIKSMSSASRRMSQLVGTGNSE